MNTKERVLKILAKNNGEYISGENISDALNISRTAIWKHIVNLRNEGYKIDAVSRRGYRLESVEDVFSQSAVASQLQTKIMGKNLYYFQEIDSTNDELKRMAANGAREGTVVLAENQLKGRGRRGRNWDSKTGLGIYMSILLKPDIAPELMQVITLATCSAVCVAIESCTGLKPGIKWPNDILFGNKKACGILTEMTAEPEKVHSVIVGIGINVNHSDDDFQDELKNTATSLKLNAKREVSRSMLAAWILGEIESLYLDFVHEKNTEKFLNIWKNYSVTLGRNIVIYQGNETWQAKALDILDNGCLLVETSGGRQQLISSGEISIRSK